MRAILQDAIEGFLGAFRLAWRIVTFNYFEVQRLRRDCGEAYQIVGHMLGIDEFVIRFTDDDVERALDNLAAAANGLPRPHDDLLPWPATPTPPEAGA